MGAVRCHMKMRFVKWIISDFVEMCLTVDWFRGCLVGGDSCDALFTLASTHLEWSILEARTTLEQLTKSKWKVIVNISENDFCNWHRPWSRQWTREIACFRWISQCQITQVFNYDYLLEKWVVWFPVFVCVFVSMYCCVCVCVCVCLWKSTSWHSESLIIIS